MELIRALAHLAEPPGDETARITELLELGPPPRAEDYTEIFLLQLYPYGSVYLGEEGMMGGEARDRIAGFWRAVGADTPAEPDHLAAMLAEYAELVHAESTETDVARRTAIRHARATFLWEHLLSWLPGYLTKVRDLAPPPYRAWSDLLLDVLAAEAGTVGPQSRLPLHLREAPSLPDPHGEARQAFLSAVLAPVRSGIILTRTDLARAARHAGLALRAGERRFALEALLDQDPAATWGWLEAEADSWAERQADHADLTGDIAAFWSDRARATARAFGSLALDPLGTGGGT